MLRAFEPWHLVVLGGIAAVLFGAKRLPDSASSIGQSLRIFRSEMDAARTTPTETPAQPSGQLSPPAPQATGTPSTQANAMQSTT